MDTLSSHQRKRRIADMGDTEMEILPTGRKQTYWNGFALGTLLTALVSLSMAKLIDTQAKPVESLQEPAGDIIKAYKLGIADALKTNPPSWQLEETCLEVWASKQ